MKKPFPWVKGVKVVKMSNADRFHLSESKIAIIGLGLMGGSLALALKGRCAVLYGIDSNLATVELARRQAIVDAASDNPAEFLPGVDIVILATPVPSILELLQQLPEFTPNPCIIFDLGSTKRSVVEGMSHLPGRFDPIGAHPLCGKEKLSLTNAESTLYCCAPFLLTPLERTSPRAFSAVRQIIEVIGAKEILLDAAEHDRILAATSHLPFLISSALVLATPQDHSAFIGPGFKSTSRLAATPTSMISGILQSNRENVLNAIGHFRSALDEIEAALESGNFEQLDDLLIRAANRYSDLMTTPG
jgi:prephenate dehydrogenase